MLTKLCNMELLFILIDNRVFWYFHKMLENSLILFEMIELSHRNKKLSEKYIQLLNIELSKIC